MASNRQAIVQVLKSLREGLGTPVSEALCLSLEAGATNPEVLPRLPIPAHVSGIEM